MDDKFPYIVFLSPLLLGIIGIIMIASATSGEIMGYSLLSPKFMKQLLIFIFCIPFYLLITKIKPSIWLKLRYIIILISIILLLLVKLFGVSINNSTRWIKIFGIPVEPTTFTHIAIVIFISGEKKVIISVILTTIISLLIFLQPDLSSAFITILIGFIMIYIKGVKFSKFSYSLLILLFLPLFFPRQMKKITYRLNYFYSQNIQNSVNSLKRGKIFGMGLGEGIDKFSSIPLPYSDNIFTTGAQELGFIWSSLILTIFLAYYLNSTNLLKKISSQELKSLGFGISTTIVIYALLNILSSINLIPITGDPLPFVSQGGSALVSFYIAAGITGGIVNENSNRGWWNRRSYNTRN
uniref:Probable peptidoglycan glycosyltransferase FtsW n=1 Tax=candidate division WOR-3 bacterium TaxID=2052148 RepID=A0A7C4Y4W1_UNCW3